MENHEPGSDEQIRDYAVRSADIRPEKQGYPIKTYLRVGKSRNGESMVFAEYRLERVEEARRRWR